jgi:hypothetical protein
MTRTSRLASSVLALSLAILPAAAFAQQTTAPATAPDSQAPKVPTVAPQTQPVKTPSAVPEARTAAPVTPVPETQAAKPAMTVPETLAPKAGGESQAAKVPAAPNAHANTVQSTESKAPGHTEAHGKPSVHKEAMPHAKPGTPHQGVPEKAVEPGKI